MMNCPEKDPLLNFYANFIVQRVQIWVLEPETNKRGCLPLQKFKVGDTDTEAVCTH